MRLDHIAFRVRDRDEAVLQLASLLGYRVQEEFEIVFDDGSKTECMAMLPPEKDREGLPSQAGYACSTYHMAPELFVSEGKPDSIVAEWVEARNGGGIHHIAYQVHNIENAVRKWKGHGVEFTSDIIDCPEDKLRQIFTRPMKALGGIIIELIQRGDKGFCKNSVKKLMESTDENT